MRERHKPEDIKRLTEDIKVKGRLTKPIRVVSLSVLFPAVEKSKGLYGLVGGTARIVAFRVLGVETLRVGIDVYIEKRIRSLEEYFDEYWLDNELAVGWEWPDRMDAAMQYKGFGWTEDRIAERLGYQGNSMVSLLLRIGRALPFDISHHPAMEKAGPKRAYAIARMWEKSEQDGRAMFERLQKDPSALASEKRYEEIATDYTVRGMSLPAALGSIEYDNSSPRLEERTDTLLRAWKEKAEKEGTRGPPFGSIVEAWNARKTLDTLNVGTASDPALIIPLEMIANELHALANMDEEFKAHQTTGTLADVVMAQFSRKANEVDGILEKIRERQGRAISAPSHSTPVLDTSGIRKTFPRNESNTGSSS